MFPLRFCDLLSIRLGLLLAFVGLVLGQGSSGRYDILRGTQGQSACTLQDDIVENCITPSTKRDFSSSILDRDSYDTSPVPSNCTCNAIFFNIWSACYYSTGNGTLPNFTQWMQSCAANTTTNMKSITKLGINVPLWAKLPVPGNTFFDLQRAVTIVNAASPRWTTLQIVLPVAVAVITLFISFVAPLIYQRKFLRGDNRVGWPKHLKRLRLRPKVIPTIDKHDTWQIDGPDSPFVNLALSTEKNTFHGQLVAPLSDFDLESTGVHETDKNSKSIRSSNSKPSTLPSVRLPWKRRPPQIRLVPATSRFRVDDINKSTSTYSDEANGRNGSSQINEAYEAQEVGDDDYVLPDDDETTNLITPNERAERDSQDVVLISKGGRNFTLESRSTNTVSVNSFIKIVSPSVSSVSGHSTMQPASTKPILHIPIPPPPPSHAAPAPPIMPRSLRCQAEQPSGSHRARPLPFYQPPSFLSPINEASTPARSFSSSNASILQSPMVIRRPLNKESVSSPHTSPGSPYLGTAIQSPSYLELRRTASQSSGLSQVLKSEDDLYMEITTNGHDQERPADDASSPSFYFDSPVQAESRQMHPIRIPTAFFPGPVYAAGYPRTYTRQGDIF